MARHDGKGVRHDGKGGRANWIEATLAPKTHWAAGYPLGFTRAVDYWRNKAKLKTLPTTASSDVRNHRAEWTAQGLMRESDGGWEAPARAVWNRSAKGTSNTLFQKADRATDGFFSDVLAIALAPVGGLPLIFGLKTAASDDRSIESGALGTARVLGEGVAAVGFIATGGALAAPAAAAGGTAGLTAGSGLAAGAATQGGVLAGGLGGLLGTATKEAADKGASLLGIDVPDLPKLPPAPKLPSVPPPPKRAASPDPAQVATTAATQNPKPAVVIVGQVQQAAPPLSFWSWLRGGFERLM